MKSIVIIYICKFWNSLFQNYYYGVLIHIFWNCRIVWPPTSTGRTSSLPFHTQKCTHVFSKFTFPLPVKTSWETGWVGWSHAFAVFWWRYGHIFVLANRAVQSKWVELAAAKDTHYLMYQTYCHGDWNSGEPKSLLTLLCNKRLVFPSFFF